MAESYGGRDEPVDTLVANLVAVNVVPVFDPLRVKEMPTEGTYQARLEVYEPCYSVSERVCLQGAPYEARLHIELQRAPTRRACSEVWGSMMLDAWKASCQVCMSRQRSSVKCRVGSASTRNGCDCHGSLTLIAPHPQGYEEAGTDLAQALTQKDKIARTKAAMSPEIARALARLSSGLYVVTAAHSNARGAMVRSHCCS